MQIIRVYTGSDGASHFEELDIKMNEIGVGGRLSSMMQGSGVIFREVDGAYNLDFHTAPRRQFVVNLIGSVDITVGDGSSRRLGSGEILLAEDTLVKVIKVARSTANQEPVCLSLLTMM